MSKLYACLRVQDFAVAVVLRGRRSQPAVVHSGSPPNVYVYQANAAARAAGIRAGMTLSQAQGRAQGLLTEPRNEQAEQQAQRELLESAQLVSPRVEDREPGLLVIDLAGVPDAHAAAGKLVRYAGQLGLAANAATSENRFAATAATQMEEGVTHIYPDEVGGFLQQLPVFAMPLLAEEKRILKLWGIRTVGEFMRLPADSLTARFGERGARLAKLARGADDTLFAAWEAPHEFEESIDFDWQVSELDPLSFLMAEPLRKACKKLRSLGSAAEAIAIDLKLSDGSRARRSVALSHPLTDPEVLLKLIRLELAAHPPGKAVEALTLAAKPVPRREMQHDLFSLARPSPEKLAVTIGRLKELMGMENVGAPATRDTHEPRVFSTVPFGPGGVKRQEIVSALGFRCYRPPVEAEVDEENDQPAHVRSRIVDGRVRRCAGPWRVNGDWWLEDGWDFAEWDVELSKGLYRLSCVLHSQRWRVVGVYD
jgi:protein ImuB